MQIIMETIRSLLLWTFVSSTQVTTTKINSTFSSNSLFFLISSTFPTSSSPSYPNNKLSSISPFTNGGKAFLEYTSSWTPNKNQTENLVQDVNDNSSDENSSNSTLEVFWEHQIAAVINLYVPPTLVILGTICNSLVVMVMAGRWFSSVSTSVYMITGTIADTASLLIALPAHWVYVNFPDSIHRSEHSHIMCKFFNFFGWGSSDYGIILTAAMTVDKAIAILFPIKAQTQCTTRRSKKVIAILFIFIIMKESHFLFVSVLVPKGRIDQLCTVHIPNDVYRIFYKNIWPIIHNLFLFFSFIVIIICNIIIIVCIKRSRHFKEFGESKRNSQAMDRSKSRQITIMLLVESFTLVILTLPFSLHVTIINENLSRRSDPHFKALNQLVFAVVFYLLYMNRCLNFCMYCVSGSRFRGALLEVLGCRKPYPRYPSMIKQNASPGTSCEQLVSTISRLSLE